MSRLMLDNTLPTQEFFIPARYLTWGQFFRKEAKLASAMERYDARASMISTGSATELLEMLDASEQMCAGLRQALTTRQVTASGQGGESRVPDAFTDLNPVSVTMEDGVLTVITPLTLARTTEQSWQISRYVRAAMEAYIAENGRPVISQPCHVIVRRKAFGVSHSYRDNENFESSRVINAVMHYLGFNDRPDHLGYTSLFEQVDDPEKTCTTFSFLSASLLPEHLDLLKI